MKTAEYETENSYSICPILEDADLDAMTDEELREERSRWCMPYADDDDPMAWEADCNYRLCERHLEMRAMTDEELVNELEQAKWAIEYWSEKRDDRLADRFLRDSTADAKDYARETRRRGIGEAA
ncbi:hypothetical protein [Sulfitobacter dubius]|uniref:hypothetical protein n=1 Tax=Sulfitobacter dubius TaxID=218673 RepID=UPI0022AEAD3F|nr:hypothetical protein [Sulfitobacter dubius]MCZ4366642.1 hypothetical protein [Sulfitobacter dubius]